MGSAQSQPGALDGYVQVANLVTNPKHLKIATTPVERKEAKGTLTSKYSARHKLKQDYSYGNELLNTFLTAYNYHLKLHLSPDDIQLSIDNFFAQYVNQDPERFRHLFVRHHGQKVLTVDLDEIYPPAGMTVYDVALEQWRESIGQNVKEPKLLDWLGCDYSTSTPIDRLCSAAFTMETCKAYFQYEMECQCGIPGVYLHGDIADWTKLKEKLQALAHLLGGDFSIYAGRVLDIIDQFIKTKQGEDTSAFWSHMLSDKNSYGSGGGTYWDGWVVSLFPCVDLEHSFDHKPKSQLAIRVTLNKQLKYCVKGQTNTSIKFKNNGILMNLALKAGFFGVEQLRDGSVQVIKGYKMVVV